MKRKSAKRRSSRSSASKRYIFIVIGIIGLLVFLTANKQNNVLGVKFLAQETVQNTSSEAPPPQTQPPPNTPQEQTQQQAPQQPPQYQPQMTQEQMQAQQQQMQIFL